MALQRGSREARDAAAWNKQPGEMSLADCLAWAWQWTAAELAHAEAAGHFQFMADATEAMGRVQVWTDIIRTEPQNADLRFKIGKHLMEFDNPEHGLGWLLSVLDIDPDHAPTHRLLEKYYRKRGKIDRAKLHQERARKAERAAEEADEETDSKTDTEADTESKANNGESPDG